MNHKIINVVTIFAIVGAVFVSFGMALWGNIIWSITNPILMIHNYQIKEYAQSRFFFVCAVITLFGVFYLW